MRAKLEWVSQILKPRVLRPESPKFPNAQPPGGGLSDARGPVRRDGRLVWTQKASPCQCQTSDHKDPNVRQLTVTLVPRGVGLEARPVIRERASETGQ